MKLLLPLLAIPTLSYAQSDQVKKYWYNGAEISSFKLEQSKYGEIHPGHAELIYVTEPFLLDKQVKNERGKVNSATVLKLNSLSTFNTGIYSYRLMTSTFRPVDVERFPYALKSVSTMQDWCGQVFQQINYRNNHWKLELRSYFENPGDQNLTLPSAHSEDGLWVTLRLDPNKLPTGKIKILPGAVATRMNYTQQSTLPTATASLKKLGEKSTYTLAYHTYKRNLTIHFDTAFPHVIRKWTEETGTGTTTATLKKRQMNVPYWNQSRPADAVKRKALGLDPVAN